MDREGIKAAFEAGEFDGVSHDYRPKTAYKRTYQTSMSVSSNSITVTKTTSGKHFDGKENIHLQQTGREILTGDAAVEFILAHPYYFEQVRPDLF